MALLSMYEQMRDQFRRRAKADGIRHRTTIKLSGVFLILTLRILNECHMSMLDEFNVMIRQKLLALELFDNNSQITVIYEAGGGATLTARAIDLDAKQMILV